MVAMGLVEQMRESHDLALSLHKAGKKPSEMKEHSVAIVVDVIRFRDKKYWRNQHTLACEKSDRKSSDVAANLYYLLLLSLV